MTALIRSSEHGRWFRCGCGREFATPTAARSVPARCPSCRVGETGMASTVARRGHDLVVALERVDALEAALERAGTTFVPHADRAMLARAVRAVGNAHGHRGTARALRHLSDVALSWADAISASPKAAANSENSRDRCAIHTSNDEEKTAC
jgi:hypothetical protein